jgi:hypothetical protein
MYLPSTEKVIYDGYGAYLPDDMSNTIGLPRQVQNFLSSMNDAGTPFHDIADWIEAYVPVSSDSEGPEVF